MSERRGEDAHKKRLRDVLESAIAFYHAVLTGSKTGEPALDYLRGRGFTDETIAKYQLGLRAGRLGHADAAARGASATSARTSWSRSGWPSRGSRAAAASTTASASGSSSRSATRTDRPSGWVAESSASAAEDGGDHGPKYLNSPATPLFDKSRTLYLIDKAKGPIRKSSQAVIVEGYTDALMAHQAGFDNVVASLGTALTPGQIGLLTRYAKKIALAYDVDAAGEKAGTFGAQALESLIGQLAAADTGVELDEVRVVRLPDGKDPDEVVRETPDRWREEVRTAQPIVDYLIDFHATPSGPQDARRQGPLRRRDRPDPPGDPEPGDARRLSPEDPQRVGRRGAVGPGDPPPAARPRRVDGGPDHRRRRPRLRRRSARRPDPAAITPVEEELLRLLLLAPEQQARAADEIGPDQLPSTPARELFRADRPAARPGRSRCPAAVLDVGADGRARR